PVIQLLAAKASTDPALKALMRVVASGQASTEQLKAFQNHIDILTPIARAQAARQRALQGNGTPLGRGGPRPPPPASQGQQPQPQAASDQTPSRPPPSPAVAPNSGMSNTPQVNVQRPVPQTHHQSSQPAPQSNQPSHPAPQSTAPPPQTQQLPQT